MSRQHIATEWDVLFVEDDGVYVSTDHVDAFKIAAHDDLLSRNDELAQSYQASMSVWDASE